MDCDGRCEDKECVCRSCFMTIPEYVLMCKDESARIKFLKKHSILPIWIKCPTCGSTVISNDDKFFRCQKSYYDFQFKKTKKCTFKKSVFVDTFFHRSHLSTKDIMYFVMHWLGRDPPRQEFIMDELDISSETAVDWSSFCREVLIDHQIRNSSVIGGKGVFVEIDEAKFGKRKYNVGRVVEGQWVFGGIERLNKQKSFFCTVAQRNKDTLLEIIKQKILPGTVIVSDCWKAYDCLNDEGFKHMKVNHSIEFVSEEGAHTQNIERTWRDIRGAIPKYGRREDHFPGYLAEYLFKKQFPKVKDRYYHCFEAAGMLYPGTK